MGDPFRLAAVRATGLLDTPPEESFDRLTRLAARLLDASEVSLAIADRSRDFEKSCAGTLESNAVSVKEDASGTKKVETGAGVESGDCAPQVSSDDKGAPKHSLIHYALLEKRPIVIDDVHTNPYFGEVALGGVTRNPDKVSARACVVIPLTDDDGHGLGAFCALDVRPRMWSAEEVEIASELALSALREIKLRSAHRARLQLAESLARSNRDLEEFAAATSQDLKSPLRAVSTLTAALEEDLQGVIDDTTRERMALIKERVLRMHRLIDGILAYGRALRTARRDEEVDVARLTRQVVELLGISQTAQVEIGELPRLSTDRAALQQVLVHLIGNAARHAGDRPVRITINSRPVERGFEICVADDGPGIPREQQGRIWGMFQRLDTQGVGLGIGLTLVKKLVERRGGTVSLHSDGAGATFCFTWLTS